MQPIKNNITEGVIWKQLLAFFFPILLGTFFQQLYNTVDAVIVGRFVGKAALAGVGGSTATLINLLLGFFVGFSAGATVVISQYYGAQNARDTSRAVHTSIALSLVGGVAMMVIGLAAAPWALEAMGTPADVMPHSLTYIRIYFCGTIFLMIYNFGAGILRAVGDSRRPLYFLIICSISNLLLDLLFVVKMNMGVMGVGIATVISQAISAGLVLFTLMRTQECYQLILREIRFHAAVLKRIIMIGLPAGLQSVMYSASNIIIQSSINGFGTDTMAAWTAYGKIDGIYWMIMSAFGISATTFSGQNFGAQKYDRIRKSVRICILMALGASVLMSLSLMVAGKYIYQLFTSDPAVIEIGLYVMNAMVPFYFTYICIEILSGAMRGTGDAVIPTIMTCMGICVLRVIWIFFGVPRFPGLLSVVMSYPITWSVTSILFIIYYLQGGWLRRQIKRAHFAPQE